MPAVPLASAVSYGVADFSGGLATRSVSASRVAAMTQTWGVLLVVPAAILTGGTLSWRDALLGLAAGLAGALGLIAYFRALAIGPMGVVSPIAAMVGALVPIVVGLGIGERPPTTGAIGIGVAAVSVLLASDSGPLRVRASSGAGVFLATSAGIGFGAFFVLMHAVSEQAELWPLLTARAGSLALLWTLSLRPTYPRTGLSPSTRVLVAASGLFDMGANILYLVAVHHGLLSVTAVTVSLYPVVVLALAWAFLHERLTGRHRVAAALAVAAAVLISV